MTYQELYNKVAASLEVDQRFSVQVETYRTKSGPSTEWRVYVPFGGDNTIMVEGLTAEEVWQRFLAALVAEEETIDQTSAAVRTAEVE